VAPPYELGASFFVGLCVTSVFDHFWSQTHADFCAD